MNLASGGEFDPFVCGTPTSFSVHLASSAVTTAGSVHKSRGCCLPSEEWCDSNFQIFSQNCQFHHRRLESLGHFKCVYIYISFWALRSLFFGPYGWHFFYKVSLFVYISIFIYLYIYIYIFFAGTLCMCVMYLTSI